MTRRQIGEALGYVKADDAIQQIHDRNKDRLDPLSTTLTLGGVEGNRWVNRNTRVYTLRGVMEICRFSRQPNADKFMDFVWDVMESLYWPQRPRYPGPNFRRRHANHPGLIPPSEPRPKPPAAWSQ